MNKLHNIIIIVVDTLRKDYAKPLENALTKMGFISYKNVIAPAPWTTPTHGSIFTGLYPTFHGAHETKNKKDIKVKLNVKDLLSSRLKEAGYETYLLSSNPYIRPEFGFIGFDHFYDALYIPSLSFLSSTEKRELEKLKHDSKTKLELAKALILDKHFKLFTKAGLSYFTNKPYLYMSAIFKKWPIDKGARNLIKALKERVVTIPEKNPKFIFINLMEVHEPYFLGDNLGGRGFRENLKTNKLDQRLVQKWREKYPAEVRYVTRKILELMKILKEKNMFDNSLIILTSDHGQLLGEHRRISHGTFLYDQLLKVPLLIKYPKESHIEILKNSQKYISLVKIKSLILNLIDNKITTDNILYSDTVLAESYGIHVSVGELSNDEERRNIEQLEKYRIALYHKNFKGIFNVSEWKFEEIISYDLDTKVNENVVKQMKKEVLKFLKTATVLKVMKVKKLRNV